MSRQFGFAQDPEGMQCSNSGPPQMTDEQIAALLASYRQSQPDVFADLQQQAAQSMPLSQQAHGQAESQHMPVASLYTATATLCSTGTARRMLVS